MNGSSALPPWLLLMMMGGLGAGALLNTWIWLRSCRKPRHLWTAGWCLVSGFYLVSHYIQLTSIAPDGIRLGSRLTWISALTLAPIMVGLTHSIVNRRCSWRLIIGLGGTSAVLAFMALFMELIVANGIYLRVDRLGGHYWASVPGPWVALPIPYLFGISIYCVLLVWRARQIEPTERRIILTSFGLYILLALNDALHAARVIQSVRVFDYAFVPVALVLTYMEVRRYTRLSESLETEVGARTAALHKREDQLSALVRAGQTVMGGLDLKNILERIVHEASEIAGTPHVKVLLVDRDAKVLRLAAHAGGHVPAGFEVPLGQSYSGTIAATGQPLYVGDTQNDPRNSLARRDREAGIRTFLGLPITHKGEVLGVLTFNTEEPHEYSDDDLSYLASFADQAAIAIENARLYSSLEDRVRRLDTLTSLNRMISESLEVDRILGRIAEAAATFMQAELVIVWTAEPSGEFLDARASSNASMLAEYPDPRMRVGEGIVGNAARARRPIFVHDLDADQRVHNLQWFHAKGFHCGGAIPILRGSDLLGVLSVVFREPMSESLEGDPLVEAFIDQAAIAIDHGRLYEDLEDRISELHAMTRLNRLISSSLDTDRVLREIAKAAAELRGTTVASFWLANEPSKTLQVVGFSDPAMDADFPCRTISFDEGVLGWVARHGRFLNVPDAIRDGRLVAPAWWRRHGLTSFLGVPVILDGTLLAVLGLNGREPFRLDPEAERLLESFVSQAALAIRNAALFAAEGAARQAAERALAEVKRLQGMLPICSYCKRIRNDENSWEQLESYISEHSHATFSHGICPECRGRVAHEFELWKGRR
ncbi:MAG TPA: GAF domain-containing protein [Methylomirabilota bacterium]|nr:GAF domain-containing protein [Methylomirabilota bacterium]